MAFDGAPATGLNVFDHSLDVVAQHPGITARQKGLAGLCRTCQECPVVTSCGGGLYAHRYRSETGFANPSVYCADLLKLITHISDYLPQVTAGQPETRMHVLSGDTFSALASWLRRRDSHFAAHRSAAKLAPRPARSRLPGRKHGTWHHGRDSGGAAGCMGGADRHRRRAAGGPRRRARPPIRPGLGCALPRAAETGRRSPCHQGWRVRRTGSRSRPEPPWRHCGGGRHPCVGQGRCHRPGGRRGDSSPDAGPPGHRHGTAPRWREDEPETASVVVADGVVTIRAGDSHWELAVAGLLAGQLQAPTFTAGGRWPTGSRCDSSALPASASRWRTPIPTATAISGPRRHG